MLREGSIVLRKRLEDSYRIASEAADHSRAQQKKLYDSRIRGAMIQVGDRVLVRALAFDGKHKLADRWEEDLYIVHSQPNAHVPVFMVEKEKGHGEGQDSAPEPPPTYWIITSS